jgi:heme/copper-type cytochrome/quinol oxidase subunit 2
MILITLIILVVFWILAACLTVKADAMSLHLPTDWTYLPFALFVWWVVAIAILFTPHDYSEDNYSNGDGP